MRKSILIWGAIGVSVAGLAACGAPADTPDVGSETGNRWVTSDTFTVVSELLSELGNPEETLIVMDDDDTLTKMPCPDPSDVETCQYLGGTAWASWQLNLPPDDPMRLDPTELGILRIATIVFDVSLMDYVEPEIPAVLSAAAAAGATLLVETARGTGKSNATASQFRALSTSGELTFAGFIEQFGLKMASGVSSLPGTPVPCDLPGARPFRYEDGVAYLDGQNKGSVLQCLLSQALDPGRFSKIIFIDDSLRNVQDILAAFESDKDRTVVGIHYTALEEHSRALTEGPRAAAYQAHANESWAELGAAIHTAAGTPNVP